MNLDENGDEVVYERYSKLDPGTPSFTTSQLKNETGRLLAIAMREPIELTSHGRPKVFMVPVGLMKKFLMLEDAEDLQYISTIKDEDFLGVEESEAFLASLGNAPDRPRKVRAPRTGKPANQAAAARSGKAAPAVRRKRT